MCCVFPVTQSRLTLCDPMDCHPPGSSVRGILQARILGWVASPFSMGSSQLRDRVCISCVSCIGRRILYRWATREAHGIYVAQRGLLRWPGVKNPPANAGDRHKRHGFNPWVGKVPWKMEWQPTPVFLPGEFHGQKSLVRYSPWGHKDTDMITWLSTHTQT